MKGSLAGWLWQVVRGGKANPRAQTTRAERHYIHKPARVTLPDGGMVQVMVKDLSAQGVSIEFRGAQLPDKVLIMEPSLRLNRWAQVVWQRAGHAGLKFIADEALGGPPQAANARASDKEKAEIRARIRKPKAFG